MTKATNTKNKNRIFVGNLPPQAKNVHLKEYFSAYGNISEATVKLDRRTRKSKCYGFINCGDLETFQKIIASEHTLIDRVLNCYPALQDVRTHHLGDQEARMVFIKGLNNEISDAQLQQYFSPFGDLLRAYGIRNASDGTSKSFGYLEFSTKEEANTVINQEHHTIGNFKISTQSYQKGASRERLSQEDNQKAVTSPSFLQTIGVARREEKNDKLNFVETLSNKIEEKNNRPNFKTQQYQLRLIPSQNRRKIFPANENPLWGPSLEWIEEVREFDSDSDLPNFIQRVSSPRSARLLRKKIDRCLKNLAAKYTQQQPSFHSKDKNPHDNHLSVSEPKEYPAERLETF